MAKTTMDGDTAVSVINTATLAAQVVKDISAVTTRVGIVETGVPTGIVEGEATLLETVGTGLAAGG